MEKITLVEAFDKAQAAGIKFTGEFLTVCSATEANHLESLANQSGFKKFNGDKRSLAHCFYDKLFKQFVK